MWFDPNWYKSRCSYLNLSLKGELKMFSAKGQRIKTSKKSIWAGTKISCNFTSRKWNMEPVATILFKWKSNKVYINNVTTHWLLGHRWEELVGISVAEIQSHNWYFCRINREDMNELFSNYSGKAEEDILHFILWCHQFDVFITVKLIFCTSGVCFSF